MSCRKIRTEVPCTKRTAEAERHSESRKIEPSRNDALCRLDKSCGDGRVVIAAALRGRIRPGGKEGAVPGSKHTVFSDWPNRGWNGEQGNGGRKNRTSGRHGKPSARRGTPSALPVEPQRRGGIEFHAVSGVRPDTHHTTGRLCRPEGCGAGAGPGAHARGVPRGCGTGLHRLSARSASGGGAEGV